MAKEVFSNRVDREVKLWFINNFEDVPAEVNKILNEYKEKHNTFESRLNKIDQEEEILGLKREKVYGELKEKLEKGNYEEKLKSKILLKSLNKKEKYKEQERKVMLTNLKEMPLWQDFEKDIGNGHDMDKLKNWEIKFARELKNRKELTMGLWNCLIKYANSLDKTNKTKEMK